jgi:voltage-gated potassium channel Kch
LFEDLSRAGFAGIWGDCTRPEILHAAQIATAKALLLTFSDTTVIRLASESARRANPSILLIAPPPNPEAEITAAMVRLALQ